MNIARFENEYTRAVVSACYKYLIELLNETDSPVKRIHIMCENGTDESRVQCVNYSIGPQACANLDFGERGVSFNARFKGVDQLVFVEWEKVLAIFSPELGTLISPMLRDPFGINYLITEQARQQEVEEQALTRRSKLRIV